MIALSNRLAMKLVIGIGCLALMALLLHDRNRWKAKTAHYAQMLTAERGAHAATVANYRAAAGQARIQDAANAARARLEQAAINERTKNDYETRIAAARSVAGRLRGQQAASADSRRGRTTPMPGLSAASGGTDEAAVEDGLSQSERRPPAEVAPLGADDALTATEQAIQLDELIKWVRRQSEVEVSKD